MATAQKIDPGTDVTLAGVAAVGTLPESVRQSLELRKLQNQVAGQLAGMNWGKSLDLATRRAVADWGQRFSVDVTTEIDVLGSNIYLNARYYLRRLAQLIERGVVEYAVADHIEDDPRLAKLGPDGEGEASRRLRERIKYGVPDAAKGAVVFRIKLRTMTQEIVGVNSCGGGTRKSDPVGDAEPVKTAESRAARRAIRQIASHVPEIAQEIEIAEAEAEHVTARISEAHRVDAAQMAEVRQLQRGTVGSAMQAANGYDDTPPERITPRAEIADPLNEARLAPVTLTRSNTPPASGEGGNL